MTFVLFVFSCGCIFIPLYVVRFILSIYILTHAYTNTALTQHTDTVDEKNRSCQVIISRNRSDEKRRQFHFPISVQTFYSVSCILIANLCSVWLHFYDKMTVAMTHAAYHSHQSSASSAFCADDSLSADSQ